MQALAASCEELRARTGNPPLEVETRVTCMAMQVLDMAELSDIPTMDTRDDAPDIIKKIYLGRVSNIIYENYVSEHRN